MSNPLLISILSALPVQPVTQGSGVQGGATLPVQITSLTTGSFLNGVIVSRDPQGNPVLRTDKGDLTLKSELILKPGNEVVLRIDSSGENLKIRIVSVDGKSASQLANPASTNVGTPEVILSNSLLAAQGKPPAAPSTPTTVATPSVLLPPTVPDSTSLVKALLITPAPASKQLLAQLPTLILSTPNLITAGAQITLQILPQPAAENLLNAPQTTTSQPATTTNPLLSAYTATTLNPGTPAPTSSLMPANIPLPLAQPSTILTAPPVISAATPAIPAASSTPTPAASQQTSTPPFFQPPTASALAAGHIEGRVIGTEKTGELLVQTPIGTLKLPPQPGLTVNSSLQLQLINITAAPLSATPMPMTDPLTANARLMEFARSWPTLGDLVTALRQQDTVIPQSLQRIIPTPGPHFAASLLGYIRMIKDGDLRNWLTHSDTAIDDDPEISSILSKLTGDITTLRSGYTGTPDSPWQMLFFPIATGGELQQAKLFVKRDGKQQGSEAVGSNPDTRFIVEVDLNRLGAMQFDGFVKKGKATTHFDLIVRSLKSLPDNVKTDINSIFTDAAEMTGFKGGVQFQTMRHFPVNPMEENQAANSKAITA